MLQDGDRVNAVVTRVLGDFLKIGIEAVHARAMGTILPKFLERFHDVIGASGGEIGNMIQIACADFQEIAVGDPIRYAPVHPGFELCYCSRQALRPCAIGSVVLHIDSLLRGSQLGSMSWIG